MDNISLIFLNSWIYPPAILKSLSFSKQFNKSSNLIGKFISSKRKVKNLTQAELAEKLNITDRAVSKWECGRSLPDSAIMLELCELLEISVNELLTGEELEMNTYNEQAELNLIELKKQKEESDKRLLTMEIVIGIIGSMFLFTLVFIASFLDIEAWLRILFIVLGFVVFIVTIMFAVKIEQTAGYYECKHCGHKYVPTFNQVLFAMHVNRTRYMKCPKCNKKSWQKKVISQDENN